MTPANDPVPAVPPADAKPPADDDAETYAAIDESFRRGITVRTIPQSPAGETKPPNADAPPPPPGEAEAFEVWRSQRPIIIMRQNWSEQTDRNAFSAGFAAGHAAAVADEKEAAKTALDVLDEMFPSGGSFRSEKQQCDIDMAIVIGCLRKMIAADGTR